MLSRAEILKTTPVFPKEKVDVPEWNTSIWIRVMTSADRDRLESETSKSKQQNFRARIVLYTACNERGEGLFQLQDLPWLGNQSGLLMGRLAEVATRLNGYTPAEVDAMEKNSESGPNGDFDSVSPRSSAAPSASWERDSVPTN